MSELKFLEQDTVSVARQLLGWRLYRQESSGLVGGVIVETEAYTQEDAASHAGRGEGVLIRALEPDQGIEIMRERRHNQPDAMLVNGPAKICQALNIGRVDNGRKLNNGDLLLLPPDKPVFNIRATERIGIKKNTSYNWRFVADVKS